VDGAVVSNPQPAPPAQLPPGSHPGAFLPPISAGHTIAWQVDSQTVSLTAPPAGASSEPNGRVIETIPVGDTDTVPTGSTGPTTFPSELLSDVLPGKIVPAAGVVQPSGQKQIVGSTPGAAAVTDAGMMSYDVPIWVPDGVRGMQPAMNISYRS